MVLNTPDVIETSLLIGFCMLLETEFFKSIGGADETLPGGDDFDLSIVPLVTESGAMNIIGADYISTSTYLKYQKLQIYILLNQP